MFVIFSVKFRGFVGTNVPYTSDHNQARQYSADEAIRFCRTRNTGSEIQFLPVALEHLK